MREAVKQDETLGAPTVGTWLPAVGRGAPLEEGCTLGWLRRDGRLLAVTAPPETSGVAIEVCKPGTWVSYGIPLVVMGQGSLSEGMAPSAVSKGASAGPEGAVAVTAETDGTVYLSGEPGQPPFAAVGAGVAVRDTLALVEVMKTFTPVKSPVAGTLVRVDVRDGGAVQEGQALFWISPG